jgi:hypothetical protein
MQQQSMAEYCSFPIEGSTSYAATNNQFITTYRRASLAYTRHPTRRTHLKYGTRLLGEPDSQFVNGRNTHRAFICIVQSKNIGSRNMCYKTLEGEHECVTLTAEQDLESNDRQRTSKYTE